MRKLNALIENDQRAMPRKAVRTDPQTARVPALRIPRCQELFRHLGLDAERDGTFCQGCRYSIADGCPNTRAWALSRNGEVKPTCAAGDLVYCKHYDCGCDHCANFLQGTPLPIAARG